MLQILTIKTPATGGDVTSLSYISDEKVVLGTHNGVVCVYDLRDCRLVCEPSHRHCVLSNSSAVLSTCLWYRHRYKYVYSYYIIDLLYYIYGY